MKTTNRKKLIQRYYSARAKDYDQQKIRTWKTYQGFGTEITDEMLETLKDWHGKTLLEIGVGSGRTALPTLEKIKPRVIGLDISKEMLMLARKKASLLKTYIELVLGDADYLPFEEESFDAIVCMSTMHYFSNPKEKLRLLFRLLRQKGVFIYGDLTLHEKDENGFFDKLECTISKVHARYYTPSQIKSLIEASGFRVSRMKTIAYRKSYRALMEDKGEYFDIELETLLELVRSAPAEARAQYELSDAELTQLYTVIFAMKEDPDW